MLSSTAAGSLREEEENSFERRASVRRVLHLDDSHRGFFGEVLLKMVCYI